MSITNNPPPAAPRPTLAVWMRERHSLISSGLLGLAVVSAALPLWMLIQSFQGNPTNFPLAVWGAWLALLCLFGGMYLRLAEPNAETESRYRVLALGLGGLAGLGTFLLGLALPLGPWSSYFVPG